MKLVFLMLGIGVLLFNLYQNDLNNMKEYMAKSYLLLLEEKIKEFKEVSDGSNNDIFSISVGINKEKDYAESIPVLVYHGIISNSDEYNVLLKVFYGQMLALKKAGYNTITLQEFYQFMKENKSVPKQSFLLTFDDGRKDSYYSADPILKSLNYTAIMFVITKFSMGEEKSGYYLSKKELKGMLQSGRWEIQAHTREGHNLYEIDRKGNQGHYYSNKLWLSNEQRLETDEEFRIRIAVDLLSAKKEIEEKLNVDIYGFAYPFGDFGQDSLNHPNATQMIEDEVKKIYEFTFYQVGAGRGDIFNYPNKNEYKIKRIEIRYDWTPENLIAILESGRNKELPFYDNFSEYKGWIKVYGESTLTEESLVVSADRGKNSATVFLDGAKEWSNYLYHINAEQIKGDYLSLLAYYQDEENYIECNYQKNKTRINIMKNGKKTEIMSSENKRAFVDKKRDVAIKIVDGSIECYIGEVLVLRSESRSVRKSKGGIGIKIWDKKQDNAEIRVHEVNVGVNE